MNTEWTGSSQHNFSEFSQFKMCTFRFAIVSLTHAENSAPSFSLKFLGRYEMFLRFLPPPPFRLKIIRKGSCLVQNSNNQLLSRAHDLSKQRNLTSRLPFDLTYIITWCFYCAQEMEVLLKRSSLTYSSITLKLRLIVDVG